MNKRTTTTPRLTSEGRARVAPSFTSTEAAELAAAAEGQTVTSFVRWAALHMARAANKATNADVPR